MQCECFENHLTHLFSATSAQVVQRGLPVPKKVNTSILRTSATQNIEQEADEMIKREMIQLVQRDQGLESTAKISDYSDDEMAAAKALLAEEMEFVKDAMDHDDVEEAHEQAWFDMQTEALYLPSEKRYGRFSGAKLKEKIASLENDYNSIYTQMHKDFKKAVKAEKKQNKLTGGYRSKTEAHLKQIASLHQQIEDTTTTLASFQMLADNEAKAAPWRKQVCHSSNRIFHHPHIGNLLSVFTNHWHCP